MKNESIKKLASLTAAAAMSLTPMLAMADTADSALVVGGMLNLRQEASLTAKVLGQYPTGTLVEITTPGQEWHQVSVNGKSGYMLAKYLSSGNGDMAATIRTNTGIGLNLREEPSLSGKLMGSYKPGTKVTVMQKGATWCRVKVEGQEGFMATQFLNFGSQTGESTGTVSGKTAVVHNPSSTQVLNLRQTASLDAKVLGYYHNGVKVTILKSGTTWHKVQVEDGKVGYMMAKYLRVTGETSTAKPYTATTFNVNGGSYVNLRKGDSLSAAVITRVPVGTKVTVLRHGTDWCKVQAGETVGYMSTWFLK